MCGIIGSIGSLKEGARRRGLKYLAHRGPDGQGEWLSKDGRVWLGHRRLAIIDPEGGRQPLLNEDGTVVVTFNGCIYNYLEIAQTLRQKGHVFKTYSDTEVIVHAYEEYGQECLDKFIGMFAFAVWDERKKALFVARDRIGVKPFYYWHRDGTFVFASEIKALLATGIFKAEVCNEALEDYLTFQTVLDDKTLFKGVYKLMPGWCAVINAEGAIVSKKQYWNLDFTMNPEVHNEDYQVDRLRLILSDAVKIRLRSDVPLGAHLSGGLDSSAIVGLMAGLKDSAEPIETFTGGFHDSAAFDETAYSRLVAKRVGAVCHEIWPTAEDFVDSMPKIIYHMDEPAAGPGVFPQYMVSKLASSRVKVILGGQGGDEIFAGYARYLVAYLEECLKGAIEETESTAEYAATLQSIIPNLTLLRQYVPMLRSFWSSGLFDTQDRRYFHLMDRSEGSRAIYSADLFVGNAFEKFKAVFYSSNAASYINRMLYFDLKVHLPALLHVEDRTSMAWGLESRVPLLDHRISEFIASVSPVVKFKGGQLKYLFKKAVKNVVPDEILARKDKMGFPVPLHLWIKGPLKEFVADTLLSGRARQRGLFNHAALEGCLFNEKEFGRTVWGALCLELWFNTFIDRDLPS